MDSWGIADKIFAVGFDTTSSNTGVHKGACTILQQLLEKNFSGWRAVITSWSWSLKLLLRNFLEIQSPLKSPPRNTFLEPDNLEKLPRGDYKEFLELAKIFLGGSIERKKGYTYSLQRPGADHHARWMSKSLYIINMSLVHHQLPELHWQTKKKIDKMALFVVLVYLKSWFNAPPLTSAGKNDISLYKSLLKFKNFHKKVSSSTCTLLNH